MTYYWETNSRLLKEMLQSVEKQLHSIQLNLRLWKKLFHHAESKDLIDEAWRQIQTKEAKLQELKENKETIIKELERHQKYVHSIGA